MGGLTVDASLIRAAQSMADTGTSDAAESMRRPEDSGAGETGGGFPDADTTLQVLLAATDAEAALRAATSEEGDAPREHALHRAVAAARSAVPSAARGALDEILYPSAALFTEQRHSALNERRRVLADETVQRRVDGLLQDISVLARAEATEERDLLLEERVGQVRRTMLAGGALAGLDPDDSRNAAARAVSAACAQAARHMAFGGELLTGVPDPAALRNAEKWLARHTNALEQDDMQRLRHEMDFAADVTRAHELARGYVQRGVPPEPLAPDSKATRAEDMARSMAGDMRREQQRRQQQEREGQAEAVWERFSGAADAAGRAAAVYDAPEELRDMLSAAAARRAEHGRLETDWDAFYTARLALTPQTDIWALRHRLSDREFGILRQEREALTRGEEPAARGRLRAAVSAAGLNMSAAAARGAEQLRMVEEALNALDNPSYTDAARLGRELLRPADRAQAAGVSSGMLPDTGGAVSADGGAGAQRGNAAYGPGRRIPADSTGEPAGGRHDALAEMTEEADGRLHMAASGKAGHTGGGATGNVQDAGSVRKTGRQRRSTRDPLAGAFFGTPAVGG